MAKQKKTPVEQKAKLIDQLKEIEKKIADFDTQRASKIGTLAKRHGLINLSDSILEKEFKSLRDKYKDNQDATLSNMDDSKKNS